MLRRLAAYLRPHKGSVAATLALVALHGLFDSLGPLLTRYAVDRYFTHSPVPALPFDFPADPYRGLTLLSAAYLTLVLLTLATEFGQTLLMNRTGQNAMFDLRRDLMAQLHRLDIAYFDRNPVGRVVTSLWWHPADGSPKAWKSLTLLSNGTAGFTGSGQLLFDPPTDWKAAEMKGTGQQLYYVRVVTTQGTGPTARSVFGRDYVGANGGSTGTIPAFDDQADKNHDGYLTDAEYASRRSGMNARFEHESRLFYPYYGQMRFVTNPGGVAVQRWAADYHQRMLAQYPLADGVFLDNSNGKLPFAGTPVKESTSSFTEDLAAAVGAVRRALPGQWVVSNTAGSIAEGDPIARESHAALEEFLLRSNDHNWSNLIDIQDRVNRRLATGSYAIIDTHSGSGSITSERTRMGALAYYYLLADPDDTFLMFFGGQSPSAAWSSVFVPAATYDVGKPIAAMTTFASGADPQNAALTYKVYGREYDGGLVLFKPRSYALGKGTGTADAATTTTHQLNGQYRQLYSDGSLGQVVTSVRLRNSEGVVLVKA